MTGQAKLNPVRLLLPILLMLTLLSMSSGPQPDVPTPSLPHFDKLAHLLVFGLLATHLCRLYPGEETRLRHGVFAVVATSLFGLLDETRQFTNPERYFEWADWYADTLGALIAVAVYQRWTCYRNLLEWKPFQKR
ncbi:MAG: VanZ family protein [Opitutales bacterium]|nr:VanZ family protein [Opitutales bacterium]